MLTQEQISAVEAITANAPLDHGKISHLCRRPGFGQRDFLPRLELCPERGVVGDRWVEYGWLRLPDGSPDPRIQIAIIPDVLLASVWQGNADQVHPGDTLATTLRLDSESLPAGTRLSLGTAEIEISDVFNDGCVKWKVRYGKLAYDWVRAADALPLRRRGAFARIVSAGHVTVEDQLIRL